MAESGKSPALSTNVMGMRFMQRRADAMAREEQAREDARRAESQHWVLPAKRGKKAKRFVTSESSFAAFEDLGIGRSSFQNFNPEVEVFPSVTTVDTENPLLISASLS
jgi:hypothetical protein